MSRKDDEGGIRILSFDSGGPGTLSQLLFLKEYMSRLATDLDVDEDHVYPADYFDLMGGVGFGGLAAFTLGHLRMNVNQSTDAVTAVGSFVFPGGTRDTHDAPTNTRNLKKAIEEMLNSREVPLLTRMYEKDHPPRGCKAVVYAATSGRVDHPQAFRNYASRGSNLNPTIVEALCATVAIPSRFEAIKIGAPQRQQSFIGGALGANNPTRELLKEAAAIFGKDRRVAQIISLGAGRPQALSLDSAATLKQVGQLLQNITVDCEMVAKELSTRLFNVDAYLRLNVGVSAENAFVDDWDVLGDIESRTRAFIETAAITEALEFSLRCLRDRVGTVTLGQLNHSSGIKIAAKKAPAVSPYYVVRKKEWERAVHHLVDSTYAKQRILVITGMGGSGKTQFVAYFLQTYPSLYTYVVFVDASSSASIKSDLQAWVRSLGTGHERDVWEDALTILSSHPHNEHSALILDGLDDPTLDPIPFICSSAVIITSRNRNVGNLSTTSHLELGAMEKDEALCVLLLSARSQPPLPASELKSAQTLMDELGCLAVALVQAGTYCRELSSNVQGVPQPFKFEQYLSLFYSHRAELMKRPQPYSLDSYQQGAYTALELSYKALPQVPRDLIHVLSCFHNTDIPLLALSTAAKILFKDVLSYMPRPNGHKRIVSSLITLTCTDGQWNELHVQETIRTLRSFSFLSVTSIGNDIFLHLHPLVQSWSQDTIIQTVQHYDTMATQVITTCCGSENYRLYRYLASHILHMINRTDHGRLHVNDQMAAGTILRQQGHYEDAVKLFEGALEVMKNATEPNETGTTAVRAWLGAAYNRIGRWRDAEELEAEVLEQREEGLGIDHPDTIMAAANLAATLWAQGRWNEAEKLELEVLEGRKRLLGIGDPDTILATANLASTYHTQGRWDEAEALEVTVLEWRRKTLGTEHSDTILAAANLAATYWAQGRLNEAEELENTVLTQRKQLLGTEHPDTILALSNLASTFHAQGRWVEAEMIEVTVLEQRTRILGKDHPDAISAAANLAATYQAQGRWTEAEQLGATSLEQRRRVQGTEHPDTILAAATLAATYCAQDRWKDAALLLVPLVPLSLKMMGPGHPDTRQMIHDLALVYENLDEQELAQDILGLLK